MPEFTVGLCGLGRIGATAQSVGSHICNHLDAILSTPQLKLIAVADKSSDARASVRKKLLTENIEIRRCPSEWSSPIDIIVDASSSADRRLVIDVAHKLGASIVILEKPVALNLDCAMSLAETAGALKDAVFVNFQRRYDEKHIMARPQGDIIAAQASYGKGILNYGTHLIDLLQHWMGPVQSVRAISALQDYGYDPDISFNLIFKSGAQAVALALPNVGWDVFEVSFYGEFGRIGFSNGGSDLLISRPVDDLIYHGYRHLDAVCSVSKVPVCAMARLYADTVRFMLGFDVCSLASLADAIHGLAVIEAVRKSARDGGTVVLVENIK